MPSLSGEAGESLTAEVERFGDFLRKRIALGVHRDAILADVLEYELVVNKFRFMQRSEVLARVESANAAVSEAVGGAEAVLGSAGRVLVRPSGTEPLVRVMVEAGTDEIARIHAETIAAVVTAELGR